MLNHWNRERLKQDILDFCVEKKPVALRSGKVSNLYIDLRKLTMIPESNRMLGLLMLDQLVEMERQGMEFTHIGGLASGAIPVVSAILSAAAWTGYNRFRGFWVRPERKGHGLGMQIEGAIPGKCVIIDDVFTTGTSMEKAADAVLTAGGRVAGGLTVVDRADWNTMSETSMWTDLPLLRLFSLSDLGIQET